MTVITTPQHSGVSDAVEDLHLPDASNVSQELSSLAHPTPDGEDLPVLSCPCSASRLVASIHQHLSLPPSVNVDDLATIHLELSAKLMDLARQLEQASFRDTYRDLSSDSHQKIRAIESKRAHCCQLNEDWEQTIKEVQRLPGFKDFLQPQAITAL